MDIKWTLRRSRSPEALLSTLTAFLCCSLAIRRMPEEWWIRTHEVESTWGRTGFPRMSGPTDWRYSQMAESRSLTTALFRLS